MHIVNISTYDLVGGAARAAYRLHQGLRSLGQDSQFFVRDKLSTDPSVICYNPSPSPIHQAKRLIRRKFVQWQLDSYKATRPEGLEIFTHDRTATRRDVVAQLPTSDVINLHWIARFIDLRTFIPMISSDIPIVWTLHDMNPLTGGCHYSGSCKRYMEHCGACPQLGSMQENDLSAHIWRRKQKALSGRTPQNLHIVTPSHWLAEEARRSSLLCRFPVHVIPYGIDVTSFRPIEQSIARSILDLPQTARIVLFVAQSVTNQRKGFRFLRDALSTLGGDDDLDDDLLLLSIGGNSTDFSGTASYKPLGLIADDHQLALVYSAADLFVIPSLEDNFPNTVLEAIACGTPVIGFAAGGIPDMVRPHENGLLVPVGDAKALGTAIITLLQSPDLRSTMSANGRSIAEQEYSLDLQARRYRALYEELLQ